MASDSQIVGIVEALIVLLITIVIILIMEMTVGTVFDQMALEFGKVVVPDMDLVYKQAIGEYLGMFKQVHLIAAIMVIMTGVWVVRVLIFGADYTRYRKGGMM